MRKTEVNKITVPYRHLYFVLMMLAHFSDGLRHISYDLRLGFGHFKAALNDFVINKIKLKLRILFYCPATKPCQTI